jgi:predicted DNA-binding transcriptional regulator YafY
MRYAPSIELLADEFHVCPRTIRRDFELLERVGCRVPKYRDEYGSRERRSA